MKSNDQVKVLQATITRLKPHDKYGLVKGEDGLEYYFLKQDFADDRNKIKLAEGNCVTFTVDTLNGNSRKIIALDYVFGKYRSNRGAMGAQDTNNQIKCKYCGKLMHPREIKVNGALAKCFCPFCFENVSVENSVEKEERKKQIMSLQKYALIKLTIAGLFTLFYFIFLA